MEKVKQIILPVFHQVVSLGKITDEFTANTHLGIYYISRLKNGKWSGKLQNMSESHDIQITDNNGNSEFDNYIEAEKAAKMDYAKRFK